MPPTSAIERAFEVAGSCATLDEVRRSLKAEGFAQVDAHLAGRMIRSQLSGLLGGKKARDPAPASLSSQPCPDRALVRSQT